MPEHVSLDENNRVWMLVAKILAEQMEKPTADVQSDTRLVADWGADSLDVLEVIINLEDSFRLTIPDEDVDSLQLGSAREFYDYICRRRAS